MRAEGRSPALARPIRHPSDSRSHGQSSQDPPIVLPPNSNPQFAPATHPILLRDEALLQFQRCNRRSFLDLFGDSDRRDHPTDYLSKLRYDSLSHQQRILDHHHPIHRPDYPRHDWRAGVDATLDLMEQGVDRIAQGVLASAEGDRIQCLSYPKLLIRRSGKSRFGNWFYVPVDIKLGKRPKLDYQVVAAFHAYVLSATQGMLPEHSWLILRSRGYHAVHLENLLPRLQDVLRDCVRSLQAPDAPEVFIAHSRCDLCHWYSHCYAIAQSQHHLSLLPGVTPSRYVHLKDQNLLTVESLAAANPKQLEGLPGFGPQVSQRIVRQAQATLHNRALPGYDLPAHSSDPSLSSRPPLLTPQELPTADVEFYFDIEASPDHNLIYLHGLLVVDRQSNREQFYPLLAETPEEELNIWQEFLQLIGRYPTAPIFHFCPYEAQTVRKLAIAFDTDPREIDRILDRFVDLHERITRTVVLPIESYALKPIARWVGFDWRNPDANGAQSICWYNRWRETGDRTYLDAILDYNEDDCRATYFVKNWLVEFVNQVQAEGIVLEAESA